MDGAHCSGFHGLREMSGVGYMPSQPIFDQEEISSDTNACGGAVTA